MRAGYPEIQDRLRVQLEALVDERALDALDHGQRLGVAPALLLAALALGDVLEDHDAALRPLLGREGRRSVGDGQLPAAGDRERVVLDPHRLSARAPRAAIAQSLEGERLAARAGDVNHRTDVAAQELALAAAEQPLRDAVEVGDPALAIQREEALAHAFGDRLGVVARVAQLGLGRHARRDVDRHADDRGGHPLVVQHEAVADVGREHRAVLVADEQLAVPAAVAAQLHHQPFGLCGVGRHDQIAGGLPDRLLVSPPVERFRAVVPADHEAGHIGARSPTRRSDRAA